MGVSTKISETRLAELTRLQKARNGEPRSAVTGNADAFGEYSLTDFANEMAILEAAGAAWGRKFCQASVGYARRGGGSYVSYDGYTPKSVVHPEIFVGTSEKVTAINFWAEHLHHGLAVAKTYGLPFVILAQFDDGLFASQVPTIVVNPMPAATIGTRLHKGPQYDGHMNLVIELNLATDFKQVSRKKP